MPSKMIFFISMMLLGRSSCRMAAMHAMNDCISLRRPIVSWSHSCTPCRSKHETPFFSILLVWLTWHVLLS